MIIVENRKKDTREVEFRKKIGDKMELSSVVFLPGKNNIDPKDWAAVKDAPLVADALAKDEFVLRAA